MKKILLLAAILTLLTPSISFAGKEDINPALVKAYNKFALKVQAKYSTDKEIKFFNTLGDKINTILDKKKLSKEKAQLIKDLGRLNNEKIFAIELARDKQEEAIKLNTYPISKEFSLKAYNKEKIFLENGIWYTYKYSSYLSFPTGTKIDDKNLDYNSINKQNHVVYIMDDGNLGFIKDYTKVRLINDDLLYGVPDKYSFLIEIKDDYKTLLGNNDALYQKIKDEAERINTTNKKEDIIKNTYNYILDNVEYTREINLSDGKIFSGIETFKNKDGVCEGYTKLMKYMLNFSGIKDVDVIRGYVIDAQDFPNIGHAWVDINNKYYDPTFDDPVGAKETRKYEDYRYYKLPKDLFYTNRYDFLALDETLKTKSLAYRENLVKQNLSSLTTKYSKNNYILLNPFQFRKNFGLNAFETISVAKLQKILPYYEVDNFKYVDELGRNRQITKLVYYTITDSEVDILLKQFNYDIGGFYLYKWKLEDGSYEHRLAHKVQLN